jgi:hypothetical protein
MTMGLARLASRCAAEVRIAIEYLRHRATLAASRHRARRLCRTGGHTCPTEFTSERARVERGVAQRDGDLGCERARICWFEHGSNWPSCRACVCRSAGATTAADRVRFQATRSLSSRHADAHGVTASAIRVVRTRATRRNRAVLQRRTAVQRRRDAHGATDEPRQLLLCRVRRHGVRLTLAPSAGHLQRASPDVSRR